jgi:hypothetical protein
VRARGGGGDNPRLYKAQLSSKLLELSTPLKCCKYNGGHLKAQSLETPLCIKLCLRSCTGSITVCAGPSEHDTEALGTVKE